MTTVPDPAGHELPSSSTPAAEARDPRTSTPGASLATSTPLSLLVSALGAALVAGLLSWGIGEAMHDYYRPSKAAFRGRYDFSALNREKGVADRKNAAIAFGTFGALLACSLGVAGGLGRWSARAIATAMGSGFVVGGLAGGLAAYEIAPIFARYYNYANPLLLPVLVRGGLAAVIGMAAGLALGLGHRGPAGALRSMTGGLLGGLLGVLAAEAIIAALYPMDPNDQVIPTSRIARLLGYLCVAGGVALGAVLLGRGRSNRVIGGAAPIAPAPVTTPTP